MDNNLIAKRLEEVRMFLQLSKKNFANRLEVSDPGYQNYSMGKRDIPIVLLHNLYTKFNVSSDWILYGSGDMFINTPPKLTDAEIAESILDNLLNAFQEKKESLTFAKKIFFSINSTTKKFVFLFDEVLEKLDQLKCSRENIHEILNLELSFFTKITSNTEIAILRDFFNSLDDDTLKFVCQNKKEIQEIIKNSFFKLDYFINRSLTK